MRVDLAPAGEVVVLRVLQGSIKIFSYADAANSAVAAARDLGHQMIDAFVVEAHAVDEGEASGDSKHARFSIAGLGPRRHRAQLYVAEPQGPQGIQIVAILVEACGQP